MDSMDEKMCTRVPLSQHLALCSRFPHSVPSSGEKMADISDDEYDDAEDDKDLFFWLNLGFQAEHLA